MKVLAPIRSVDELEMLAGAGAEELYCGIVPREWTERYTGAAWLNRRSPVGGNLESWGELLDRQAKYGKAREHFERAREIHVAIDGPEHPSVAAALHRLGRVAYEQGEYDKASEYFRGALEIAQRAFGPDHPALGRALTGLGTALKRLAPPAAPSHSRVARARGPATCRRS